MENLSEFIIEKIEELVFYRVSPEEALVSTNLLDSIALIDLTVAIQNKTGINIAFNDINADNFETVNRITNYLNNRK